MRLEQKLDFFIQAWYNGDNSKLIGDFYENGRLEAEYRRVTGMGERDYVHAVYADLDDDFPFAERFISSAGYYLASMLVIEENSELADRFFDMYSTSMTKLISEIPATAERIVECY